MGNWLKELGAVTRVLRWVARGLRSDAGKSGPSRWREVVGPEVAGSGDPTQAGIFGDFAREGCPCRRRQQRCSLASELYPLPHTWGRRPRNLLWHSLHVGSGLKERGRVSHGGPLCPSTVAVAGG